MRLPAPMEGSPQIPLHFSNTSSFFSPVTGGSERKVTGKVKCLFLMMQLVQSLPARNIVPPGEYQKLSTKSIRIKQRTEVKKKKNLARGNRHSLKQGKF